VSAWQDEETTECWFDEPLPGDRRSWAVPPGHGTYQGLDLERLDPDDEHERTFLLEAQHLEMEEALEAHEEIVIETGETMNPTLHVALHGVIANQLLNDEPPETWQTVQRLTGLGYDWHNVMHMIMGPVSSFLQFSGGSSMSFPGTGRRRRRSAAANLNPPDCSPTCTQAEGQPGRRCGRGVTEGTLVSAPPIGEVYVPHPHSGTAGPASGRR
jgi:hypothetical protein